MNISDLFTALEKQTLVLTPNRRLSAYFNQLYNHYQQSQGKNVWPTAKIHSLSSWLQQIWQELQESNQISLLFLMNEHQTTLSWQQIINQSSYSDHLLNVTSTAQMANEAWKMLQQWNISIDENHFNYNADSQAFLEWANAYKQHCQQHHCYDASRIASEILQHHRVLQWPSRIILACFDELPPIIDHLFATLKQQTIFEQLENHVQNNSVNVLACDDQQSEYKQMALWAREELLSGKQYIACVLPNLNQERSTVERIFNEVFDDKKQFNISAGQSFTTFPVIHHAFHLLQLSKMQMLPLSLLSQMLRSPFLGDAVAEKNARALFDAKLHHHGELFISLPNLIDWSQKYAPRFSHRLAKCDEISSPKNALPSAWSTYFSEFLARMGWPGEVGLNSQEYQVVQRWLELLSEFASLDHVVASMSLHEALSQLQQLATNLQFQTQSTNSPVQILGILEAAGMSFDSLWVMNLDDENWPASAKPNPFIPLTLQRLHNMPHATASRELAFSQQLTERFATSAHTVIFSHAIKDKDRVLRPSPLLSKYTKITREHLRLSDMISVAQQLFETHDVEIIEDHQAPAISSNENIKGGSGILKSQAACPFQAFARVRLNATSLEEPHLGLNALQRGVILHSILEKIWRQLKTHQHLCNLPQQELTELVSFHVSDTLNQFKKKYPHNLSARFQQIEQQRLNDLVLAWLDLEKQRQPFTVISQEVEKEILLANILFQLRADRIDQLDTGEKIIIDYKTAKTSINDWFGERLSEPQLPLYSLCDEEIAGLLLAQVRIDELCFKGLSDTDTGTPGITEISEINHPEAAKDWKMQRKRWQQEISALAENFAKGHAAADPKNKDQTCARCDLQSFCRISSMLNLDSMP